MMNIDYIDESSKMSCNDIHFIYLLYIINGNKYFLYNLNRKDND